MSAWTKVVVPRASCRWPNLCPDCLRPNPDGYLSIRSDRNKLKGSVFDWPVKYKYLRTEVPFCTKCGNRAMRKSKIAVWLIVAGGILTVALAVWFKLMGALVFLLGVGLAMPGCWLLTRGGRVVRIASYDQDSMILKIKRPEYAREVAQLNNVSGTSRLD